MLLVLLVILECNCSEFSSSSTCEGYGGQCQCIRNVKGRDCRRCESGTFNISSSGCSGEVLRCIQEKVAPLFRLLFGCVLYSLSTVTERLISTRSRTVVMDWYQLLLLPTPRHVMMFWLISTSTAWRTVINLSPGSLLMLWSSTLQAERSSRKQYFVISVTTISDLYFPT